MSVFEYVGWRRGAGRGAETSNVAKQNTIKDYVSAGVNGFKLVNTLDIGLRGEERRGGVLSAHHGEVLGLRFSRTSVWRVGGKIDFSKEVMASNFGIKE